MSFRIAAILLVAGLSLAGCDDAAYTLYRNSILDTNARYHVATFDAAEPDNYNQENCAVAQELFQKQPGVKTRFWCEKGKFRK
jgi:hypothetical protein